jgi:uncharacterized protein (TIGR02118 family)
MDCRVKPGKDADSGYMSEGLEREPRSDEMSTFGRLLVLYGIPKDPHAFDKHYFDTHVPIAKKIPWLRKYEVSRGGVFTPARLSKFYLIATLHFDDVASIRDALASPEGQAALADLQDFAAADTEIFIFDDVEV